MNRYSKKYLVQPKSTDVASKIVTTTVDLKVYEKPVLTTFGDVRDVTLGGSPGGGDSGGSGTRRVPN